LTDEQKRDRQTDRQTDKDRERERERERQRERRLGFPGIREHIFGNELSVPKFGKKNLRLPVSFPKTGTRKLWCLQCRQCKLLNVIALILT
jgi:hypothetical protein